MRYRMNVYLPPEVLQQVTDLADRKKLSKSSIIEAAVTSFLSEDGTERREAAFTRRLDRMVRQLQRLERNDRIQMETVAGIARMWLTFTPPLPPDAYASAQATGQKRYREFLEFLVKQLHRGKSALDEIAEDVDGRFSHAAHDEEMEGAS